MMIIQTPSIISNEAFRGAGVTDENRVSQLRAIAGEYWPRSHGIGNTPLRLADAGFIAFFAELARVPFTGRILFKLEGDNRSGTHKCRPATAHVAHAIAQGCNEVTIATCGNAGEALAIAAALAGIACTIFLPEAFASERLVNRLKICGAKVIIDRFDYDRSVELSTAHAARNGKTYDANSGGPNKEIEIAAIKEISKEIAKQYKEFIIPGRGTSLFHAGEEINGIFLPCGNGTLYGGVFKGFEELAHAGKFPRMRVFGGSPPHNNPIQDSFRVRARETSELPEGSIIVDLSTAALAARVPLDGRLALEAAREGGGIYPVREQTLLLMRDLCLQHHPITNYDFHPIPAGVAGLQALALALADEKSGLPLDGTYVVVISGEMD